MFDLFDPSKIFIVGVVALIVIGPKELPRVMRTVGQVVGRMRRMAADFQQQFNEAMREAELEDLRKELAAVSDAAKADVSGGLESVDKELAAVTDAARVDVSFDPATLTQHDNVRPLEAGDEMTAIEGPAPNGAAAQTIETPQRQIDDKVASKAPGEAPAHEPQLADDALREGGAP
jgi:sec-independent protein translocase protein TatB